MSGAGRTMWARMIAVAMVATGIIAGMAWSSRGSASTEGVPVDQITATTPEDVPAAIDGAGSMDLTNPELPTPLVEATELRSGGPRPDGIPAIDDPKFLEVADVDFLKDREPVVALEIGGEARAYPIQIMMWHEIVNDTVDGTPVAVTYCPLCNSSFVWDRRLDDRILDFGTSGKLWNSSLVMYDRQTRSLWGHFTGDAIAGWLTGSQLESFPAAIVAWEDFRTTHPDALVLSRDTGVNRQYGRNPYPGYDNVANPPFLFDGEGDPRLAAKERVLGVESGGEAVAIAFTALEDRRVIPFDLGGRSLVAIWSAGTASALDGNQVSDGFDVGATNVIDLSADSSPGKLSAEDGATFTSSDGTTWNILGHAIAGSRRGDRLATVTHVDTFWFAWAVFQPDTGLIGSGA